MVADRPLYDLSESEATALAEYDNAMHPQRLIELADILLSEGIALDQFDGSLRSVDLVWQWAVKEARAGYPGIPDGARSSHGIAFGHKGAESRHGYLAELVDQYVLAVVRGLRPEAHWSPELDSDQNDYGTPKIFTDAGVVRESMMQSAGVFLKLFEKKRVPAAHEEAHHLRARLSYSFSQSELAVAPPGPSVLAPLAGLTRDSVDPPRLASTSATWGAVSGAMTAEPARASARRNEPWLGKSFDLGRDKGDTPWTSKPLDEKKVADWLYREGFVLADGSSVSADTLRSNTLNDPRGLGLDLVRTDGLAGAVVLIAGHRLRGLDVEPRTDDANARREMYESLIALASAIRGSSVKVTEL